jgi:glutamate-1-semialdehyde 2,1-aminomutase
MELGARARTLATLLRDACSSAGIVAQFPVVGTLVGAFFGAHTPTNFDEAKQTDEQMYARLFHAMLAEGVAMAPGAYEALFVGLGHDDTVMQQLAERTHRAALAATRA